MLHSSLTIDNFSDIYKTLHNLLLDEGDHIDIGEWQAIHNPDLPMTKTVELLDVSFQIKVPETMTGLQNLVAPNLPWAEDHFLERVSGEPLNPPPSAEWWPYAQKNNTAHKNKQQKFSHTYPERMWPKHAEDHGFPRKFHRQGIRFPWGDLGDVVQQLVDHPLTRQSYLPIWFPEDTGATHGERVPCTLGYHFIIRGGQLRITYYIRSCDFLRHFRDDVYMAARLAQWVADEITKKGGSVSMGTLTMHIVSLHVFEGDIPAMEANLDSA